MTLPLYQVVDWNEHFENAKSRTYEKQTYVCVPNKQGGSGWSNVMGEVDGAAVYGIWMSILQLCSRQRRPREGWLTADGKKSGRRLSARELSYQFRRPIEEIHRTLQVVNSERVSFMRLVEGQPEFVNQALKGYPEDTAGPAEGQSTDTLRIPEGYPKDSPGIPEGQSTDTLRIPEGYPKDSPGIPEGQSTDTAVSVDYPQPVSPSNTERKKERKKEPPAAPQGGQRNGYLEDSPRIPEGYPKDSPGIPEGQSTDTAVSDPESAKILICEKILNGKNPQRPWSYQAQARLSELLPIPLAEIDAISWFRSIPKSDDVPELKFRRDPITETTLMDFWGDEVQRAQEYRRKYYGKREVAV
jgi:hypothetical protein